MDEGTNPKKSDQDGRTNSRSSRVRPAVPERSPGSVDPYTSSEGKNADDDAVIVPAPGMDAFVRHRRTPLPAPGANQAVQFRRTLVPILLTLGLMLPALAGLWFMADDGSPFKLVGRWLPFALLGLGAVLLSLGLVNIMVLKHQLKPAKA
jgi:hypothetical protein